jgi:hypothetical protein
MYQKSTPLVSDGCIIFLTFAACQESLITPSLVVVFRENLTHFFQLQNVWNSLFWGDLFFFK